MAGFGQTLIEVRKRINGYREKDTNEQNTKTALIDPILRALGWDVGDLEEVFQEYKRKPKDKPVDYALLLLRTPKLFVEAKALGQNLDDRKWANQIMGYAGVAGVAWVVLTDGDEYRIYNAHATVPIEEKLFRTVRISDAGSRPQETLELLSKERTKDNIIDVLWNAHFVDRQIHAALNELFSSVPDPSLLRLLSKRVRDLSGKEIRASLARVRAKFDFPIEPKEPGGGRNKGPKQDRATPTAQTPKSNRDAQRVSKQYFGVALKAVIDAGLLNPPLKLRVHYKGRDLEADLLPDGTVRFNGQVFNSCSTAADEARRSVVGGNPHTNGWTFWSYRNSKGQAVLLDVARRELLRRKVR